MITIFGATGAFGNIAIKELRELNPSLDICAAGRNQDKLDEYKSSNIKTAFVDYDDIQSIDKVLADTDILLFISGNDLEKRMPQHRNIVASAVKNNVKHIVYTSFARNEAVQTNPLGDLANDHKATENLIIESGIKYSILRNTLYMEFEAMFTSGAKDSGVIALPTGDGKIAFASREDMAKASAHILADAAKHENKIYNFSGSKALSFYEIAEILSAKYGKQITYQPVSVDEFVKIMEGAGVPREAYGMTIFFGSGIAQSVLDTPSNDISDILGRPATSYEDYIKSL
jgi:NAD(P)H dehydrogenase (quinone)